MYARLQPNDVEGGYWKSELGERVGRRRGRGEEEEERERGGEGRKARGWEEGPMADILPEIYRLRYTPVL